MPSEGSPPTEVAPPPAESAPTIATEPEPPELVEPVAVVSPTVPPPADTMTDREPVPAPRRNGRGMLAAAGVIGAIGMIIKVGTTIAVARENKTTPSDALTVIQAGGFFYNPILGTALGLAGGGMAARGKVDAHKELFLGEPATRPRRRGLGWGLFGGGVAMWGVTRLVGSGSCRDQVCASKVWEVGYYLSLAGTVPGVIMGGYASGFHRYQKRYGHLADVSVAPIAHRDAYGLSLSARF